MAQASRAGWPERSDHTAQIQRMTRELQITDRPQDAHREMRAGGLNPCEHGNSRAHPPSGPISCGTTVRGPSLFGRTHDAP